MVICEGKQSYYERTSFRQLERFIIVFVSMVIYVKLLIQSLNKNKCLNAHLNKK